tara:strand:- start:2218 stop:2535 length:318 start_codon:yes stop_codon:yes gene_type:complete
MIGHIIDVEYDDGTVNIAKITLDAGTQYVVSSLVCIGEFYRFSRRTHIIPKESVTGFYDTTDLEETGLYMSRGDTYFEAVDMSDTEYECESNSSSDTEVSLDNEF